MWVGRRRAWSVFQVSTLLQLLLPHLVDILSKMKIRIVWKTQNVYIPGSSGSVISPGRGVLRDRPMVCVRVVVSNSRHL